MSSLTSCASHSTETARRNRQCPVCTQAASDGKTEVSALHQIGQYLNQSNHVNVCPHLLRLLSCLAFKASVMYMFWLEIYFSKCISWTHWSFKCISEILEFALITASKHFAFCCFENTYSKRDYFVNGTCYKKSLQYKTVMCNVKHV